MLSFSYLQVTSYCRLCFVSSLLWPGDLYIVLLWPSGDLCLSSLFCVVVALTWWPLYCPPVTFRWPLIVVFVLCRRCSDIVVSILSSCDLQVTSDCRLCFVSSFCSDLVASILRLISLTRMRSAWIPVKNCPSPPFFFQACTAKCPPKKYLIK